MRKKEREREKNRLEGYFEYNYGILQEKLLKNRRQDFYPGFPKIMLLHNRVARCPVFTRPILKSCPGKK